MSRTRAFWILCGATFFEFLALGIFLAGLPLFLTGELHTSRATVGLTVGAFSLSALTVRPLIGRIADRRGRKQFLILAPALVSVTGVALTVAHVLPAVFGLRVLQGLAGAGFYTCTAAVATDLAPSHERADYIARFSLFLYAGFALGPSVAEWAVSHHGFKTTWLLAAGSAATASALASRLPETRPATFDDMPRVPLRFVHPAVIGPGLVLTAAAVGYATVTTFSPLYARHIGMASSGLLYLAFSITAISVRLVSGRIADRYGVMVAAIPGVGLSALGLSTLAATPGPGLAILGVVTFAAGFSMTFPAVMTLAVNSVDERERGEALGSTVALFDVGAFFGGYLVGAIADSAGYGWAFLTPAALSLVAGGLLLGVRRRNLRDAHDYDSDVVPGMASLEVQRRVGDAGDHLIG